MPVQQRQRFCKVCGGATLHQREVFGCAWGCLLTIVTAGLFLPFWLLIDLVGMFRPWRCQRCGHGRMT